MATVISTRCIWVVRTVRAPVPAMTSHIMIGCDDVIRLSLAVGCELVAKMVNDLMANVIAMEMFYEETKH